MSRSYCGKLKKYCYYNEECYECNKIKKARPQDIAEYFGISIKKVKKYYYKGELDFISFGENLKKETVIGLSKKGVTILEALYRNRNRKLSFEEVVKESVILDNNDMTYAVFISLVGKKLISKKGTRFENNIVFWIENKGIKFYENLIDKIGEEEIEDYICS